MTETTHTNIRIESRSYRSSRGTTEYPLVICECGWDCSGRTLARALDRHQRHSDYEVCRAAYDAGRSSYDPGPPDADIR